MLSVKGRKPAAVVVEPIARTLLRAGLTPNSVTVAGTVITVSLALILIPTGHLFAAAVLIGAFAAVDMLDGTMARMRGGGTKFGATLDASCDRIADGALFSAIAWWLVYSYDAPKSLVAVTLVVLVCSQVISYIKARGEASGFTMNGGLVERPERFIISLVGIGLCGLGVPHVLEFSMWLLAIGSVITVVQRLLIAKKDPLALEHTAAPKGANTEFRTPVAKNERGTQRQRRSARRPRRTGTAGHATVSDDSVASDGLGAHDSGSEQ